MRIHVSATRPFAAGLTVAVGIAGCSLVLDFDDIEGLPCECRAGFVCLSESQTCIRAGSVDDFKSCDVDAVPADDQCGAGRACVDINGRGPRCLPACVPLVPFVSEVGRELETQCGDGRYCWEVSSGQGYCDEGECNDLPDDCPPPQRCVRLNGAGVCFETCDIFSNDAPCGATGTHCQPVAETRTMACLPTGARQMGEVCSLSEGTCDDLDDQGRTLICARAMSSTDPLRRCAPRCNPAVPQVECFVANEGCFTAIANVDSLGRDLGICEGG